METGSSVSIRPRILVVDDEVAMVRSLELLLRPLGQVVKAYSVPEALESLQEQVDCVVTDVNMPEESGLNLLEKVRAVHPQTPVIVMTAYSSVPEAVEAMQRGAFEYLVKPFENDDLLDCVRRAIEKKGLVVGETQALPSGWVCNSDAMKTFVQKAEKLSLNDHPILIVGETGAGKRRAARWMFECRFSQGELVVIDSYGQEQDHPLMRVRSDIVKGIYIAEVFALKASLQDRLVEILDEGKIKVFAGTSSSPDVQKGGSFRQDLYERLCEHILKVPSLAERSADFEALCYQLIASIAQRMRLKNLKLEEEAIRALKHHNYVGNVKELEKILERSAIETRTGRISEKDLQFERPDLSRQLPFSIPVEDGWGRLEFLHRSLEKDLIIRTIEKYPNLSNTQIASILGTTRRILELRMKTYQIRES